jgi:hypothetical protein
MSLIVSEVHNVVADLLIVFNGVSEWPEGQNMKEKMVNCILVQRGSSGIALLLL